MIARIRPSRLNGTAAAPPSKSYAHRLLIAAALSGGDSRVNGISESRDMQSTLDCLSSLGLAPVREGDTVRFGQRQAPGEVYPCFESGSTLRFMLPIILTQTDRAVMTGTSRLIERGVGVYDRVLDACGVQHTVQNDKIVLSGRLRSGTFTVPGNVSSQYVSGLLMALPLLPGDSTLCVTGPVESRPYIDLTRDVLSRFGIVIRETDKDTFFIPGGQAYRPGTFSVEGDWSNAAALLAFDSLGGGLTVTGLNEASLQGDRVCRAYLQKIAAGTPVLPVGDCPDLAPVLMAAAALKNGATLTGTRRLRIKESDRGQAMAEELEKFGVPCRVEEDSITVGKASLYAPDALLSSHNDHRLVMALSLLASVIGGAIDRAEAVAKSWPDYFDVLSSLGLEVTFDAG